MSPVAPPTEVSSDTAFERARKTPGLAIASLVCGIVGFCVPGLGIGAIVLGIVVLARGASRLDQRSGRGLAGAGIALGVVSLFVSAVLIGGGILLPALSQARVAARRAVSEANLRQINSMLLTYAAANGGSLPEAGADWKARLGAMGAPPTMFVSPHAGSPGATDSYIVVLGTNIGTARNPARTLVAYENPKYAKRGRIAATFADGGVHSIAEDELESLLEELNAASPEKDGE